MKKTSLILAIILITLFTTSCTTINRSTTPDPTAQEEEKRLALSDARPDIIAVVTAIYNEMIFPKGKQGGVVFFDTNPAFTAPAPEKEFGLADVYLEEDYQPGEDPFLRRISGVMRLSDSSGREDYRAYAAEYILQEDGILILSSAAEPVYGKYDRIRFFFVEKDQLPPLSYIEKAGYEELLPLVAKNASIPLDIRNINGMKELYIFAFDMTKGKTDSDLILHSGGSIADTAVSFGRSINNKGWRFVMLEGTFRLGENADYSFYLTETSNPKKIISVMNASLEH